MHNRIKRYGAGAVTAAGAITLVAACSTATQVAPQQPAQGLPVTSTTTTASQPSQRADAHVGQSITLNDSGQSVQVTLTKVLDPVSQGQYAYETGHIVGAKLTFTNLSSDSWHGDPDIMGTLVTADGQQAQIAITSSDSNCSSSSDVTLTPGSTQQTCVAFKLPEGTTPAKLQMRLGFGDGFGEWDLRQ